MSDTNGTQREIAQLASDNERLRAERDAFREELEGLRQSADDSISTRLRLLSKDLAEEVRERSFSLLRRVSWAVGILVLIGTAGGLWTASDILDRAVEKAVRTREKDVAKLRENIIDSVVAFKLEAGRALQEIAAEKSRVVEASSEATRVISISMKGLTGAAAVDVSGSQPGPESDILTIPVVVHVLYRTEAENIPDSQIHSQIEVLTQDFRAKNADISKVPEAFQRYVGDAGIEFALATVDSEGRPTSGITRTQTNIRAFGTSDGIKFSRTGGVEAWDTQRYLNLWVGNLRGGILGYSQFPGGPRSTDGVVTSFRAFGREGTLEAAFDKGRTATEDVGHFLNLRHIWGDTSDCTGTDFVIDTPVQQVPNTGKPSFPSISCENGPDGDMFMNFMDYVDDDSKVMFTKGQVMRMRELLLQGTRQYLVRR